MSVLVFVFVVVGWGALLGRVMGGTGTWLPTGGAVGSASLTQVKSEDGSADVDVAMGMLGVVVLVGLGWFLLSRYGAHAGELMSTVVGLRLHSLYPYAHPTHDRDDYAPLGWVMTLYRTEPSSVLPWDGESVDTALDTAWYPTRSKCSDVAHHAAWRLNGERVPGSSFGTTGPAGQPSPTWRYGVVIAADPPWHGYAFQWVAVSPGDVVYGPDLGPIRDHARSFLVDWSGQDPTDVATWTDDQLRRSVSEYVGLPGYCSLGTLYAEGLEEDRSAGEDRAAGQTARARASAAFDPSVGSLRRYRAADRAFDPSYCVPCATYGLAPHGPMPVTGIG